MKLYLNNILLSKNDYTASDISVDIQDSNESDQKQKTLSQEFEFTGDAFELIKATLIESPGAKLAFLSVKIFDDGCCDQDVLIFDGILQGSAVDWCWGECKCRGTFVEHTEKTKIFDCLKSTLLFDNHNGFQSMSHPRMRYCVEMRPAIFQYAMLSIGVLINIILASLIPIVAVISVIISIINAIIDVLQSFGSNIENIDLDGNSDTNTLEEFQAWRDRLNDSLIGCSRSHPSPYVRSYISNVCSKCGIGFQSSIFTNPASDYFNTVLLSAPVEKGTKDPSVKYIYENRPILSLTGFLAKLMPVFSADWDIIDNNLVFEREDYFWNGPFFVNYESLNGVDRITDKLCFSFSDEDIPAYARLEYQVDALDWCGNEAKDIYNNVVEWNQPFNEVQTGESATVLEFSMSRFRGDKIDPDVLEDFANVPWLSDSIAESQEALILPQGTAWNPKLLIIEPSNISDARVKRFHKPGIGIMDDHVFNYPFIFSEHECAPNTEYLSNVIGGSLYKRFHAWKNPKILSQKGLTFRFAFQYDCANLTGLSAAKFVGLPNGTGRIKTLNVNLKSKIIKISGSL